MGFLDPFAAFSAYSKDERLDTHAHLPFLREVARGNVVEIGTFTGISTAALLCGVTTNGGHVYSIDGNVGCAYAWHGHPLWTFIWAYSNERNRIEPNIPKEIDVLFVDGNHTYSGCMLDLIVYGRMVKSGGLILVHDVQHPDFPGVESAYLTQCSNLLVDPEIREGSFGLGVIRVP